MPELSLPSLIEACLFVSDAPLSDRRLADVLSRPLSEVRAGLAELRRYYIDGGRALELVEIAEGYRIATRADLEPTLARIFGVRRLQRLSRAALEVLSIIAYRHKSGDLGTAQDVEQIRGVDSYAVIKGLMEQDFIRQAGRKEVPGAPLLYATTTRFLEYFGLKDLKELPDETELDALFKESQQSLMESATLESPAPATDGQVPNATGMSGIRPPVPLPAAESPGVSSSAASTPASGGEEVAKV